MPRIPLTLAIAHYDHVIDMALGAAPSTGIDLTTLVMPIEDIFQRFEHHREWHVSEYSFAKYVAGLASGDTSLSAIPVFPSRMFRASSLFVRTGSDLRQAEDLAGRRVGIPEWVQTAGIYLRAWLADQGVGLADVDWIQGGVSQPGRRETVAVDLPTGVSIQVERDRALEDLLLAGEIDAIATARPPAAFERGDGTVRQLLVDPTAAAWDAWDTTGVYPIMHAIVVRADVLDANPWVGAHLYRAFCAARAASMERAADLTASRFPIPFGQDAFFYASRRMGELFPYGVDANRTTLEAFLGAAYDQGVTARPITVEELFHPGCEAGAKV